MKLPEINLHNLQEGHELNEADKISQLLLQFDEKTEEFLLEKFKNNYPSLEKLLENYSFDKPTFGLSQSKIKSYYDVLSGKICGKAFEAALNGERIDLLETSPAMVKGQLFEYEATGQKNYWDEIPDDSLMYTKSGALSASGKIIKSQAEQWKRFSVNEKLTRIKPGYKIAHKNSDFNLTATPDVFCKTKGKETYIDLKFSDPHGTYGKFGWADEKLGKNEYLLLQSEMVLFIHFLNTKEQADFIFYIASSSDETDGKARKIVFENFEAKMESLYEFFKQTYTAIDFMSKNYLFVAEPNPKSCRICNLKCDKKTTVFKIKDIII